MNRKRITTCCLILLLSGFFSLSLSIQGVQAISTITIKADGSIDPQSAPISVQRAVSFPWGKMDVYTFTDNINTPVVVERGNLTIDGAGHKITGDGTQQFIGIRLLAEAGLKSAYVRNLTVSNAYIGIVFEGRHNSYIIGCNVSNNLNDGILFTDYCYRCFVEESVITGNGGNGIHIQGDSSYPYTGCRSLYIYYNNISANGEDGVRIEYGYEGFNIVYQNIIANNGGDGVGIHGPALMNSVNNNTIANNSHVGVHVLQAGFTGIQDNDILSNSAHGVEIENASDGNVRGNNIRSNQGSGIRVRNIQRTSISENILEDNLLCGIDVTGSSGNTIYHNDFLDNANQVCTQNSINQWNTTYKPSVNGSKPSGGNYWSDYTGVDLKKGVAQNETGTDGIGDTSRLISANNVDAYPLMTPYSYKTPTTITCIVTPAQVGTQGTISVNGTVSPTVAGASVTLTYKKPDGSTFTQQVTTNSQGVYKSTYAPTVIGEWSVQATWAGSSTHAGATSAAKAFSVTKTVTTVSCSVSPSPAGVNSSITVSGSIAPPVSGAPVTLLYKRPEGSTFERMVTTGSTGSYSDTFMVTSQGDWSVKASWPGDASHLGAESQWRQFIVEKKNSEITCSVSPSEVSASQSVTVSGQLSIPISGVTIALKYKNPQGTTTTRTVTTDSSGRYSDTYTPDSTGDWTVSASWEGNDQYKGAVSSAKPFTVKKSGCLIATSTFGSELSPEVQFLRGFRDNTVLSTFAGSCFMTVFNSFYYSFSPSVASTISDNGALQGIMRTLLYPLVGTLHLSSITFDAFSFNPELGVVVTGLVASSLIALVYVGPCLLLINRFRKITTTRRSLGYLAAALLSSLLGIAVAEITRLPSLMMTSTALYVLTTMGLTLVAAIRMAPPALKKLETVIADFRRTPSPVSSSTF